ncbi:hypothetical protein FACS1894120_1130 [Clostridia bacterium]|nr:hypothetical protein FACS1894120_1130 [Clostridia bacterium]
MAFVSVPKDLSRVKTKVVLNLTKRQLICFSSGAAIGVPTYLVTHNVIGNSPAALLMITVMLPLFFLAMYEKDGQSAEKIIRNYVRTKFVWAGKRPYKTENFYSAIEREGKNAVKSTKTAKAVVTERPRSKGERKGNEVRKTGKNCGKVKTV